MKPLTDVIANLILPPAGPLLLLVAALLLLTHRRRAATLLAVFATAALWISSTGFVGNALLRGLEAPPLAESMLPRAEAIVVLGGGLIPASPEYGADVVGGETLARLRYAALLARRSGLPVLVSGGRPYGTRPEADAMAEALAEMGVQARWKEVESITTAENAARASALLGARKRVALVTSAWHMPRAKRAFTAAGFEVLAAPTGFLTRAALRPTDFLPSVAGMSQTRLALWESLGMLWYHLRS
jgi:uncharacterized SAM-binding protein YcdF (DUF218 family)